MRIAKGKLVTTVFFSLCIAAIMLVIARNIILDHATSAMKTGKFDGAATKLKLLASIGDSTAQSLLGDLYAYGWGVSKDDEIAIYWYRRASPSDLSVSDPAAPAMYYVGERYLEGKGITRNAKEARKWFERSAKGGYTKATEQLEKMPEAHRPH